MIARIQTAAFQGVEVTEVDVQVQIASGGGVVSFTIVGLPDKAIAESRDRVRAALGSLGLSLPAKRILVNLAPADLAKEGSHFDLPIAVGLLVAMGVLPQQETERYWAMGELSLDGGILPVSGVLPAAIAAHGRDKGIICPAACGPEAAWAGEKMDILAPPTLLALINHFKGAQMLSAPRRALKERPSQLPDLRSVRGQLSARRALEIAAAGGHNLLMAGPPGAGKSMLAACLPGILPPLAPKEMLEVSMIHSVAGKLEGGRLSRVRPYRDPHHSTSMPAMVGGGKRAVPGEISLAHRGVLFLDELPEFPRAVLEALRQPMETGTVSVARVQAHVTYPAEFQFVAAMNPCRCGYLDDPARACGKAPRCAADYQARLSGPLLDRIDLHIDVPAVDTLDMLETVGGESSAAVAARVAAARQRQEARYGAGMTNARLQGDHLLEAVRPDAEGQKLLEQATQRFRLSMRAYTRVLKTARTIADLEAGAEVRAPHIAEALTYRKMHYGRVGEEAEEVVA